MKKAGIFFTMIYLIGCNSLSSNKHNSLSNETKRDTEDIEVKIIKDTATWVDGNVYKFIKIGIYNKYSLGDGISFRRQYIPSTGRISVGIKLTDSNYVYIQPVLMYLSSEALYLADDFENYEKSLVKLLYSIQYAVGKQNNLSNELILRKIEVDFDKINKTNPFPEYPNADKKWYSQWKEKNPDSDYIRRKKK